jgi:hypothetical protein
VLEKGGEGIRTLINSLTAPVQCAAGERMAALPPHRPTVIILGSCNLYVKVRRAQWREYLTCFLVNNVSEFTTPYNARAERAAILASLTGSGNAPCRVKAFRTATARLCVIPQYRM